MANNYGSLEGTMDANNTIVGAEIQFNGAGGRVKDVQVNDVSVVDANGIAKIDLTDYAKTEDIPADLADLQDDETHRLVTDAEKTEWSGKSNVSANPSTTTETLTGIEIDGTAYAIPSGDVTDVKVNDTSVVDENGVANIDLSGYAETTDIHNPTITIQKNGQNVDTFTLNQTTNKVIDISVPTKTSDLQNDSSFITNTVNNLANYYLKSDTYTQTEVNNLISAAVNGRFEKVTTLPASGEPNVIYLVPKTTALTNNVYDEYIWQDNAWELLGSTEIDLSNYVTTTDLSTALADYVTSSTFNTTIANYYTKTEIGNLLDGKVDKVSGKGLSTNDYDNTAKGIVDGVTNALAGKVDKVNGKGLSTEDYTTTEKNKLAGISTNANKVEASTTNGNIKIDDTETQVYDDSDIQDKIDETTTNISGNPISIPNLKSNQLAVNPIITLEPIQDLHGQSKPYPAGGGKNLYSGTNVTISSALYSTVSLDKPIPAGTYTVSAKLSSELTTGAGVSFRKADNSAINRVDISYVAGGRGYGTVTISEEAYKLYFYYSNTTSGTGTRTWSDVQIESGSQPTAYAPYENICPISGYDKIEVSSCGKNIFNKDDTSSIIKGYISSTILAGDAMRTVFVKCKPNTKYTVSKTAGQRFAVAYTKELPAIGISVYGAVSNNTASSITITTGADAKYVVGYVFNGSNDSGTADQMIASVQIEESASATTYVPYNKTTDLSESLGQTVYGGTLDVRTGKLVNILKKVTFNGAETEGWQTFNGVSNTMRIAVSDSRVGSNVCKSNMYYWHSVSEDYDMCFNLSTTWIYVRDTQHTSSVDAWKTFLQSNPLEIYYEMATYGEIQLTPHEISLLKDYAYVSTNGTNISLDYHNGELASLSDVAQLGETVNKISNGITFTKSTVVANAVSGDGNNYKSFIMPHGGLAIVQGNNTAANLAVRLMGNVAFYSQQNMLNSWVFPVQTGTIIETRMTTTSITVIA